MLALQNADVDEEAELNIFCVTCGIELAPRVALRHMEKCFNKVISVDKILRHLYFIVGSMSFIYRF